MEGDHYSNESSGHIFRDIFTQGIESQPINTFKEFVNTLWNNPSLVSKDAHLRYQTDFLLLSSYNHYFSLKDFQTMQETVLKNSDLIITDTRKITKHTTYGYDKAQDSYYGSSSVKELCSLKSEKIAIKYENFYDEEDSYKVTLLYLNDIITYIEKTKDFDSTRDYLHKGLLYSTNYQI